jgi:hypothetical protein
MAARTARSPSLLCEPWQIDTPTLKSWNLRSGTWLRTRSYFDPDGFKAWDFTPRYVPTIIIGERYWEGYSDILLVEMEATVEACLDMGCPDLGSGIVPEAAQPGAVANAAAPGAAQMQSNGFTLAVVVMVGMVAALVYGGLVLAARTAKAAEPPRSVRHAASRKQPNLSPSSGGALRRSWLCAWSGWGWQAIWLTSKPRRCRRCAARWATATPCRAARMPGCLACCRSVCWV